MLIYFSSASAHSVRVNIYNNSTISIRPEFTSGNYKGFFCNTFKYTFTEGNTPIDVGEAQYYTTGESAGFCGVSGFLDLCGFDDEGTKYKIHITYDNPFIGDNEFHTAVDFPFRIKFLGGGEGSDMEISFDITGGPEPSPPPPPIELPNTGNKTVTGQFSWDANETGEPQSGDLKKRFLNYLTTAFKVEVVAPAQLGRNKDGSGNDHYQGYAGYYTNYTKLENLKIVFIDSRDEKKNNNINGIKILSPVRIIKFYISNLPANIPLHISVNTRNANWNTGRNTPPAQPGKTEARWMVFVHPAENTIAYLNYEVYGAWFYGDGGYSSNHVTSLLINNLKKKLNPFYGGIPADIKGGGIHKKEMKSNLERIKTNLRLKPGQEERMKKNVSQSKN